ncbi:MAG: CBS domain-containing protein [Nitrospiraceae bacterium]|nr:CBS domain-containing protein [Nitrospiraceae bacterium]MSR24840.1 CBS domain-containing protein [Nitrospiraceae bacterium]
MGRPGNKKQNKASNVMHDVERLRLLLASFQPFLSQRKPAASLDEFDAEAEELIGELFGETSELRETYEYAKMGEAAALLNMQEEAQEGGAQDTYRESLQQRKQALDSCVITLQTGGGGASSPLANACVSDYMSHDVRSVHKDVPIKEAGRLLQKWKVGSLLVDDGSRYLGIITDTDLSRKAVAKGMDPNTTAVKSCMSKPVISIEDDEPLATAIALMKKKVIRHIAVTEDGTIIGVLSVSDILRAYAELAGLNAEGQGEDGD